MAAGRQAFGFRLAQPGDVPALAALYADCARVLGPQVYSAEQVAAWASFGADTAAFRNYILSATTWVAVEPGHDHILGFCGVDNAGEVHSLYVSAARTRRGLGSALLDHTLVHARLAGITRFGAWATPFSRPVFERAGLKLVAIARAPYQGVWFDRYRVETG